MTRMAIGACLFAAALAAGLNAQGRTGFGAPLPGLLPAEFERFRIGLDDFVEVETAVEGLGPGFNATSCAVCHNVPAIGGAGTIAEVRAGRRDAGGRFQTLDATGETLFHLFSIPTHGCQAIVPPEADVFARRVPIPLFGAGLVEAIPDDTIVALDDPFDRDRDAVATPRPRLGSSTSTSVPTMWKPCAVSSLRSRISSVVPALTFTSDGVKAKRSAVMSMICRGVPAGWAPRARVARPEAAAPITEARTATDRALRGCRIRTTIPDRG